MQRKFLEDLGLEKEVIDKIMTENGNDINNAKSKLEAERDSYKSQFETVSADLAKKDTEYNAKIADMEFNSVLDNAITSSKAKNSKAVKALLDLETLKSSKNQPEDIKTALEKIKSENDYLFESAEPIKNPVAPTNNPNVTGITKETFNKMGYAERLKLKHTNPEKYSEMKGMI